MKKAVLLLTFFFLLFIPSVKASHLAGGEIWYKYIGTSAHPHRYKVYLGLYRDVSGLELCNTGNCTRDICITSSCFSTINVTLNQVVFSNVGGDTILGSDGSIITPSLTECVDANSQGIVTTEYYVFSGQVDLPGTCLDYAFSFSETARNPSDNLYNSNFQNFYIESILNNTNGPNSSPHFINPGIKDFCVNHNYVWVQTVNESDGDSINYTLGNALGGNCGDRTSVVALTYNSGYSSLQPITTNNGVTLNQNGFLSFNPIQQEVDDLDIRANEYRFDSTSNQWLLIGSTMRDMLVPITSQCDTTSFNLASTDTNSSSNILFGFPYQEISCGDSIIHIVLNKNFISTSLDTDGSDFGLVDSYGQVIPILKAGIYGLAYAETNEFWLKINGTIYYDDTLRLYSRPGNDLNTLLSNCGDSLPVNDTILVGVNTCNTRFTLSELNNLGISVFPNPAKGYINVNLVQANPGKYILSINDLSGKLIFHKSFIQTNTHVDISKLPPGTYVLSISGDHIHFNKLFQKL